MSRTSDGECPDCGTEKYNVIGFSCEHARCPVLRPLPCTCMEDWGTFEPTCSDYSECSRSSRLDASISHFEKAAAETPNNRLALVAFGIAAGLKIAKSE